VSEIVRTVTRWIFAFIATYGVYLVAYGHLTPGGGFAGGVMLASGYVLLVLSRGAKEAEKSLGLRPAKALDSVGALLFLAIAVLGLVLGQGFFENFIQKSTPGEPLEILNAGIIPLCNIAIALKVMTSLFVVFVVMASVRFAGSGEELEYTSEEE